jgi:hypothetical protein
MTPDKNFRLSTSAKRRIALTRGGRDMKLHVKNMQIESQLCEEAARRAALKSKDTGGNRGKSSATFNVAAD